MILAIVFIFFGVTVHLYQLCGAFIALVNRLRPSPTNIDLDWLRIYYLE